MMINQFSYRMQLKILKELAQQSILQFPVKTSQLHFIQHGENTTYRLTEKSGRRYLLRIHRLGYHSPAGIKEELTWLERLAKETDIVAPRPLRTKQNKIYALQGVDGMDEKRHVSMFEWVDGRNIGKSVNTNYMKKIAELTYGLHRHTQKYKVKHRRYWGAQGLSGKRPFMGPMDCIVGLSQKEQAVLNEARKIVYSKLSQYEKRHPQKMGLIHADLHFGNMFAKQGEICPIDFDDCGYGFHMYDLAVTISSLFHGIAQKIISKREYSALNEAFLQHYNSLSSLHQKDIDCLQTLKLARRFLGTQWLNLRADNPKLKARSIPYAKETVKILKKSLKL